MTAVVVGLALGAAVLLGLLAAATVDLVRQTGRLYVPEAWVCALRRERLDR